MERSASNQLMQTPLVGAGNAGNGHVEEEAQALLTSRSPCSRRFESKDVYEEREAVRASQALKAHASEASTACGNSPHSPRDSEAATPLGKEEEEGKVTLMGMTVNLILCGLGCGVLTMPQAMASAGVVNAMVWMFIVLSLNYITNMQLVYAGDKHQVFTMEGLLERLSFGTFWRRLATGAILITFFLCLVGYILAFRDTTLKLLSNVNGWEDLALNEQGHTSERYNDFSFYARIVGCVVALPLCLVSQKYLSYTSTFAVFINLFIVFAVIFDFATAVADPAKVAAQVVDGAMKPLNTMICVFAFSKGDICYVSCALMAIVMQPGILPMYEELKDRRPETFAKALKMSSAFLYVLFFIFALFGYTRYGAETLGAAGNILQNFPANVWYCMLANAGMAFVTMCIFPLMIIPMVAPMKKKYGNMTMFGVILAIVFVTFIGTFFVKSLDVANAVCGAFSVFFLVGLFPGLIAYHYNGKHWTFSAGLMAIGLLGTVLGLIFYDAAESPLMADAAALGNVDGPCAWPLALPFGKSI